MGLIYITIEQAVKIYEKTVEISGGGFSGVIDLNPLESCLAHIQNDDYYPEFIDKLNHLFFCACKSHCFIDGNKRIAISLGAQFLLLNGYVFVAGEFIREMENISYHVAAGKIEKELLKETLNAIINQEEPEELKMKLLKCINS